MQTTPTTSLPHVLKVLTCLLILKIIVVVILSYRDYMPPNFGSDFLHGRGSYFAGCYRWAFYAHITSGPCSLLLGMILINQRFRQRFSMWHRSLGRIQVLCVLCLVTPSGLWMACYAETGAIAGFGFAALAAATATCVVFGWRSAVKRRFAEHRRWMLRCFVLLCSAVVLRLIGGLAKFFAVEAEWVYPIAAWTSWLVPLVAFEWRNVAVLSSRGGLFK